LLKAQELASHKITVNAFAPGNIDTPALKRGMEVDGFGPLAVKMGLVKDIAGAYELLKSFSAIHEIGTVEDVAAVVSFLVSPEAKYVTGQTVSIVIWSLFGRILIALCFSTLLMVVGYSIKLNAIDYVLLYHTYTFGM
jgi:NAD(P)-dependent dehydrogenase (short-subunit alcohol dehydrogenase family)